MPAIVKTWTGTQWRSRAAAFWDGTQWVAATLPSYPAEVLADAPAGYWRLGETSGTVADDASPNNRDGAYQTGVTLGQDSLVNDSNPAALFNGTSGHVQIPAAGLGSFTSFTVEAWVKPDAAVNGTALDRWIYRYGIFLRVRGTGGGQLRGGFFGAGGERMATGLALDLFDGVPHHLVVTYDGVTIRLYVDGVPDATLAQAPEAISYSSLPAIGQNARFNEGYWHGVLDEVAVYPTALSAARVAAHYATRIP